MKRFCQTSFIILSTLIMSASLLSCGGGGGDGGSNTATDDPGNTATTPGPAPKLVWTIDQNVKNPVTDLGRCAESVIACVGSGTALQDCFTTQVPICTSTEPDGSCCTQACGDQLAQLLSNGVNEDNAFLEVFVYDGSCMPGITRTGAAP